MKADFPRARLVTVASPLPIGKAVVIRAFGAEAGYAVGAVKSGDAMGGARDIRERGTCLQDHLGLLTAMDAATKRRHRPIDRQRLHRRPSPAGRPPTGRRALLPRGPDRAGDHREDAREA